MTLLGDSNSQPRKGFATIVVVFVLMLGWLGYSYIFERDKRPPPAEANVTLSSGRAKEITPPPELKAEPMPPQRPQAESVRPLPTRTEPPRQVRKQEKSAAQKKQEEVRLAAMYAPATVRGVGIDGRRIATQGNGHSRGQSQEQNGGSQVQEIPSVYNTNSHAPTEGASGNQNGGSLWTKDFYERGGNGEPGVYQRASSPFVIRRGWKIPARLDDPINSDLPGQITATVTQDIRDSATGRYVLIPAGTQLVGGYDTQVSYGQERVPSAWDQLNFPNGDTMQLAAMPGADRAGMAGVAGEVNNHTWQQLKYGLLMTVTGAAATMARSSAYGSGGDINFNEALALESGQEIDRRSQQTWNRGGNRRPTITVDAGGNFMVLVTAPLRFDGPYRDVVQEMDYADTD